MTWHAPRPEPRALLAVAALVLIGAAAVTVLAVRSDRGAAPAPSGLPRQTGTAGGVEVTVTPRQVDAGAVAFELAYDTHSGALDFDPAAGSQLSIAGVVLRSTGWAGDGPGGHHREDALRFAPADAPRGQVRLQLGGLPEPAAFTRTLPG